jgi:restriction endonuclease S subunit
MKLKEISSIRTGAVLSRLNGKGKEVRAITLKALDEEGYLDCNSFETVVVDVKAKDDYFAQAGDVLIRLTAPYTATVISEENAGAVVSSHYAIIRCKESINPWYLFWWLKQNKDLFFKAASGSVLLGTISSNVIAELPINVIPLEQQYKIEKLILTLRHERELLLELLTLRQRLASAVIKQINEGGKYGS